MTKTIRAHQVQAAAEKLFGPKLVKLSSKVDKLAERLARIERNRGAVAVQEANVIEEGAVLNKKKELSNASSNKR